MNIPGTLTLKVEDEQLDQIVIAHCQNTAKICIDIIELEMKELNEKGRDLGRHHAENVIDYENYLKAMNTVIEYFGGKPIYTSEDESAGVDDATTDGSTGL